MMRRDTTSCIIGRYARGMPHNGHVIGFGRSITGDGAPVPGKWDH